MKKAKEGSHGGRAKLALMRIGPYIATIALLAAARQMEVPEATDLLIYDYATTRQNTESEKEVAIVGIGEEEIKHFGWPIDDKIICSAIRNMLDKGAKVIALDIYRDQGVGKHKECLQAIAKSESRVVSIFNAASDIKAIPGTPPERRAFNDIILDKDNVARRDLVHVGGQTEEFVALPLRMLEVRTKQKRTREAIEKNDSGMRWVEEQSGGYEKNDSGGYQWMLRLRKPGSFQTWGLREASEGKIKKSEIAGKLVLIGSTAPSLRDEFEVAYTRFADTVRPLLMPGVEIHANRLANLLSWEKTGEIPSVVAVNGRLEDGAIALAIIAGVATGEGIRRLRKSLLVTIIGLTAATACGYTLLVNGIWIGMIPTLLSYASFSLTGVMRRAVIGQKHQEQIRKLLGQTTSPAVATELWKKRNELLSEGKFEGVEAYVTILFADTCNFTGVSENLGPREVLRWLNKGMGICIPAITRRNGMVNKFTGDGFLAVFGAPVSESYQQDAEHAVEAALEIRSGLEKLNAELSLTQEKKDMPELRMRIGIHSGMVIAGSMGCSERLEYAIIGDAVNCASRLESLEKDRQSINSAARILISGDTQRVMHTEGESTNLRFWGQMKVKGREQPLEVWEIINNKQEEI